MPDSEALPEAVTDAVSTMETVEYGAGVRSVIQRPVAQSECNVVRTEMLSLEFQTEASRSLIWDIDAALHDSRQCAILLQGPTGCGKTYIATTAIDEFAMQHIPQIWYSSLPEINRQTRRKIIQTSKIFQPHQLHIMESGYCPHIFAGGDLYFLNSQLLNVRGRLVTEGKNAVTIYQAIVNTLRVANLILWIDEAHLGSGDSKRDIETIQSKICNQVPIIVGISCTPRRFLQSVTSKGNRVIYPTISIEPKDVLASGIIKPLINIIYTDTDNDAITMFRAAINMLLTFTDLWHTYCGENGEQLFNPLLVIQVQDGDRKTNPEIISRTNIEGLIDILAKTIPDFDPKWLAHTFSEHDVITIGGTRIRYLAPSDVDADPDCRFLFIKTAGNTGWDCKRAEVMWSDRPTRDEDNIAQTIGRMVRAYLARIIPTHDLLNSVQIYLCNYDYPATQKVVAYLTGTVSEVKTGKIVNLTKRANTEAIFKQLETIPQYVIPSTSPSNPISRLMRLATMLEEYGIHQTAVAEAKLTLLNTITAQYNTISATPEFAARVAAKQTVRLREYTHYNFNSDQNSTDESVTHRAHEDIHRMFDTGAGDKLGGRVEGIHTAWYITQCNSVPNITLKLHLCALCEDNNFIHDVHAKAQQLITTWTQTHVQPHIYYQSDAFKSKYEQIERLASEPQLRAYYQYPETIQTTISLDRSKQYHILKHIYVKDPNDLNEAYPGPLGALEATVADIETRHKSCIGFLRIQPRANWAMRVPYNHEQMFPDFLFINVVDDQIKPSIIDPHGTHLSDFVDKIKGLAHYAEKHGSQFHRIETIIQAADDVIRSINLQDPQIRQQILDSPIDIHQLEALSQQYC